jgi:hypothetical protein
LQSFFARTNLPIADKYIVTASTDVMVPQDLRQIIDGVISQPVAWKLNEESF